MNADQVQTIINEAAKNLPGHLALILLDCEVSINEEGDFDITWPLDVSDDDFEEILSAVKTAAEHYRPPQTLH